MLGHEIQHGFNHAVTRSAYTRFETDLRTAAAGDHDYTTAIDRLISSNRTDEAEANLAGWNALVGMVKQANPDATLADIYNANVRTQDIIKREPGPPTNYIPHPDIRLNEDLSITASADNIEGMAKHYFDKSAHLSQLGHNGTSDYRNYYGAYAVGRASQYEALSPAPDGRVRMTINMQQLGLQESLLEQNGITLGAGTPAPQPYYDSSTTPPTLHHFDHTASTHAHVPIAAREFAGLPIQAHDMPLPNAADRALHEQIRDKVAALDAANGRSFDATSERLSASLLVVARENGLDRVDHVVLSRQTADAAAAQNIFVVRGRWTIRPRYGRPPIRPRPPSGRWRKACSSCRTPISGWRKARQRNRPSSAPRNSSAGRCRTSWPRATIAGRTTPAIAGWSQRYARCRPVT